MFIQAASVHIGLQGDIERLKNVISFFSKKENSTVVVGKRDGAVVTFQPDDYQQPWQWQMFGSGYFGVSHAFFERVWIQLNVFCGYLMQKISQTDFFEIPYFIGGELIAGWQFKNGVMFGFSGGVEGLWDRTNKILHKGVEIQNSSSNSSPWLPMSKPTNMRGFVGPVLRYQVSRYFGFFAKMHFTYTLEKQGVFNVLDNNQNDIKYRYMSGRLLMGAELTF